MNRIAQLLLAVSACVSAQVHLVHAAEPAGARRGDLKANRILFLGNSITRNVGWMEDDRGMAASALEKDYVHVLANSLAELTGKKPALLVANIADFERNSATYDVQSKLKEHLAFKADIVVVAIGENTPGFATEEAKTKFKDAVIKLLTAFKNNGQPALFVRSCFWADATKDELLKQACLAVGGVFVDMSSLDKDESNYARSERSFTHAGVAGHPGDKGMKAIADALLKAINTRP